MLAAALVPSILPPGVLYEGHETNVLSRTAYLPMATAMAGLGLAVAGLWALRRTAGVLAAAVLALMLVDGNRHVAFTERVHGLELRYLNDLCARIADQARPGRVPLVLTVLPDSGFAGIPSMGPMLDASQAPPFTAEKRLELRFFRSSRDLREWLAGAAIGARDVCVVGVEHDAQWNPLDPDPALGGARNRARRLPRALSPIRAGLAGGSGGGEPDVVLEAVEGGWRADAPVAAHALGAVELELDEGAAVQGALRFAQDPRVPAVPVADPGSPGTRLALEVPLSLPLRFGEPLEEVLWEGAEPPARAVAAGARLAAGADPAGARAAGHLRDRHGARGRPALRRGGGRARGWRRGIFARLEVRFEFKGLEASLYSDAPLPPDPADPADPSDPVEWSPRWIHLDGAHPAPVLPEACAPWSMLLDERILPPLTEGDLNSASFRWRVTLHLPGGSPHRAQPVPDGALRPARGRLTPPR